MESNFRTRKNDWVEDLLIDWGFWTTNRDIALSSPTTSSIKVIEEMRPERLKNNPPKRGDLFTNHAGKPLPASIRHTVYDLLQMWSGNQKSSKQIRPKTPSYMPHHRMSKINIVINGLKDEKILLWEVVSLRYVDGLTGKMAQDRRGIKFQTFYKRIAEAKKYIKIHLRS